MGTQKSSRSPRQPPQQHGGPQEPGGQEKPGDPWATLSSKGSRPGRKALQAGPEALPHSPLDSWISTFSSLSCLSQEGLCGQWWARGACKENQLRTLSLCPLGSLSSGVWLAGRAKSNWVPKPSFLTFYARARSDRQDSSHRVPLGQPPVLAGSLTGQRNSVSSCTPSAKYPRNSV